MGCKEELAALKATVEAMVAKRRLGGLAGGPARARALTPDERSTIASKAAKQRWVNHRAKLKPPSAGA